MNKKKITVIIEARTGSSRLPNKVIAEIEGKPMIFYVIDRIKQIKSVEQIILATTQEKNDQILTEIAEQNSIETFIGDSVDVLNRDYQCALQNNADPIIRITGDCPLTDPDIVEKMLQFYLKNNYDYVSNRINPKYPDGLDVEIFSFKTLQIAAQNAQWSSERELVTTYITKNPKIFKIFSYENQDDLSHHRWCIDEQKDLEFVRRIYSIMKPKTNFPMSRIMEILSKNPELTKINSGIMRNEGHLKLYANDKLVK
tara:strand:- start:451 stop:1218 length:768 start_codon:yes stop_codon:yes gene_type:complete